MPPTFPQELIDDIAMDPSLDASTLAACARVSRAFTGLSRKRLYTKMCMDIPVRIDSPSTRLLRTFAESPQLCALVHELTVKITARYSLLSDIAGVRMDVILPNLRILELESTIKPFWFSYDFGFGLCKNLVAQPSLRHLGVSRISILPATMLESGSRLTSITINNCTIFPDRDPTNSTWPAIPPSVEKFVIRQCRMDPLVLADLFGDSAALGRRNFREVEYGVCRPWDNIEQCQAFLTKFGSTITDLTIRVEDDVPTTDSHLLDLCALSKLQRLIINFDSFSGIRCIAPLLNTVSSGLAEVRIITREEYAMQDIWGGVDSQLYETATFMLLEIHLGIPGFPAEGDDRSLRALFMSIAPGLIESHRFRLWVYRREGEEEVAFKE